MPTSAASSDDIVLLIPLFNDWESLRLLLDDIDQVFTREGLAARVLIVDDGSTLSLPEGYPGGSYRALQGVEVLELRRNLGHQRAIAIGLAHLEAHGPCRAVVLMDSDGEDALSDIPRLLARCDEQRWTSIVFAERTRRSESAVFIVFYKLFNLFHTILVGDRVRVGNFSAIPWARLTSLVVVSELWNHYAAAVFRSQQPYCTVPTHRAKRLRGKSKMSFVRLVIHGLSALSVYGDIIGVRLLVATLVLAAFLVLGISATVFIRLTTDLAIPGWATSALGILTILLSQAVLFFVIFSFLILSGRQGSNFLPCRDYSYFVAGVRTLLDKSLV